VETEKKYTTIALDRKSHAILMDVKHDLEKELHCSWSFGKVIIYLCERYGKERKS
jgi:hypothetical protein